MTLTQKDLDEIENIVDEKVDDKIKNLPTKDEFYEKMDEVVGELKGIREELPVMNHQISDHEDRIHNIEDKLQIKSAVS